MATRQIRAPTGGIVVEISAAEGAQVTAGQDILIFESMKMEIPVEAPCAGTVTKVHVSPGQEFAENDILLEIAAA